MNYRRIELFGNHVSRGTFDDVYETEKYNGDILKAYEANDYAECDFVMDDDGILYIEAKHVAHPDRKLYHRLIVQHCPAGLAEIDDAFGAALAITLLTAIEDEI
jgi:hypothetical protein